MNDSPVVIKLGGSLLGQPQLPAWLAAVNRHARGRAVIVPGGGHYAGAVRARTDLTAEMAHYQALLAMRRTANDFISLYPGCKRADSLAAVAALLGAGETPIAVPVDDWLFADDIPASWDWTSDSLALWLAHRLPANRLLLVKAMAPEMATSTAAALAEQTVVDRAFPALLDRVTAAGQLDVFRAGAGQAGLFGDWLAAVGEVPYCTVMPR